MMLIGAAYAFPLHYGARLVCTSTCRMHKVYTDRFALTYVRLLWMAYI